MSGLRPVPTGSSHSSRRAKDDWEDWEDDEIITPIDEGDEAPLSPTAGRPSPKITPMHGARRSMQGIKRLKSRQRQKAQNAKAGITLVTDMAALRQQQQQQAGQSRTGRFVDAAALNALEGMPVGDSSVNLPWSKKKKQGQPPKNKRLDLLKAEVSSGADVSPINGPIMIGFAMPEGSDITISPQTAVVETPVDYPNYFNKQPKQTPPMPQGLPSSVWSPDTEPGIPSPETRRVMPAARPTPRNHRDTRATSILVSDDEYEVPTPKAARNKRDTKMTEIVVSEDEDDMDTPVTLFEEDGMSPVNTRQKSFRTRGQRRSTIGSQSRSHGWWDQVTSPFGPRSPGKTHSPVANSPESERNNAWWKEEDKKVTPIPKAVPKKQNKAAVSSRTATTRQRPPSIIIEDFSTRSKSPSPVRQAPAPPKIRVEKSTTIIAAERTPVEMPPPYSPPPQKEAVRYRAVLPPGHPLAATLYPPSPGPVSPGLSRTMTSQGAISLTNVPLTPPAAATRAPRFELPMPPPGTFAPGAHFVNVSGHGPRQKAERKRRRHEKEEVMARKAGGLWRGRGCIPKSGCFGRSGREGRKRRRVCFGICSTMLGLIILAVVLGVTLSRRGGDSAPYSPFLNLTDFPPIPTGIATVVGPNTKSNTVCVQPSTLWTCSLPKEKAGTVAPFTGDQPTFVFQIQFDNNTRKPWNITGQEIPIPKPISTNRSSNTRLRARGEPLNLTQLLRRLITAGQEDGSGSSNVNSFNPDPAPPPFQDMFFLGNTTDGVVSDDKAGEPTPFYISVLESVDNSVGPNTLTRRADDDSSSKTDDDDNNGIDAPPPVLNPDGTGAPALLYPFAKQQPLRLYDRGLPTERYAFYTYYNKTHYATAIRVAEGNGVTVPNISGPESDRDGGATEDEATFLITFLQARLKVEIWTRSENTTRMVSGPEGARPASNNATQPGTFPYPVTVSIDTHGGIPGQSKFSFARGVVARRIVLNDAVLVLNFMNQKGDLINPSSDFNPSFGGRDGGTGGCKCEYSNFIKNTNV